MAKRKALTGSAVKGLICHKHKRHTNACTSSTVEISGRINRVQTVVTASVLVVQFNRLLHVSPAVGSTWKAPTFLVQCKG